jgi:DNA-binding PadR family transcriptional regulator
MTLPGLSPTLLVLASLADGSKHGYAMTLAIEEMAAVRLGPGTLYGAITRLEEAKLIEPLQARERQQPYRITAAGQRALRQRLEAMERFASIGLRRLEAR